MFCLANATITTYRGTTTNAYGGAVIALALLALALTGYSSRRSTLTFR